MERAVACLKSLFHSFLVKKEANERTVEAEVKVTASTLLKIAFLMDGGGGGAGCVSDVAISSTIAPRRRSACGKSGGPLCTRGRRIFLPRIWPSVFTTPFALNVEAVRATFQPRSRMASAVAGPTA